MNVKGCQPAKILFVLWDYFKCGGLSHVRMKECLTLGYGCLKTL
jgi:hypothetical protein